jgi:hypothetical protein
MAELIDVEKYVPVVRGRRLLIRTANSMHKLELLDRSYSRPGLVY